MKSLVCFLVLFLVQQSVLAKVPKLSNSTRELLLTGKLFEFGIIYPMLDVAYIEAMTDITSSFLSIKEAQMLAPDNIDDLHTRVYFHLSNEAHQRSTQEFSERLLQLEKYIEPLKVQSEEQVQNIDLKEILKEIEQSLIPLKVQSEEQVQDVDLEKFLKEIEQFIHKEFQRMNLKLLL